VTVFGRVYHHVRNQPTRSTQPCIPPGSLNRVPASAEVKAGIIVGLPLTSSFLLEYSSEYLNEYSSTRYTGSTLIQAANDEEGVMD